MTAAAPAATAEWLALYSRLGLGADLVPIPAREKGPRVPSWQTHKFRPADFAAGCNLGLRLGREGLMDVDLDCSEALRVASLFLPPSGFTFGRASARASHRIYRARPAAVASLKLKDPALPEGDATIIELRGLRADGAPGFQTVIPGSVHPSGEAVEFEPAADGIPAEADAEALRLAVHRIGAAVLLARAWPPERGGRNDAFLALAGALAHGGWTEAEAADFALALYRILWGGAADEAAARAEVRATFSKYEAGEQVSGVPSLKRLVSPAAVDLASGWLGLDSRGADGDRPSSAPAPASGRAPLATAPWPEPLHPAAFHGLAGEWVRMVLPHTEADAAALLLQFLAGFGNLIGRAAHFVAEADSHFGNLFVLLVGATAKGRKGSSWGHVHRTLRAIDPAWADARVLGGLSSGEGLVWAVRDPITERCSMKDGRRLVGHEEVVTDEGEADKRVLCVESEFSSVLQRMGREANSLSAILRQGWDSGDLRVLTKKAAARATGAHISIAAHITRDELRRLMIGSTEASNGLANRFLFAAVRRSKCLPEGGAIDTVAVGPIEADLRRAAEFARNIARMDRDEEARSIWHAVYPDLSEGRPGLLGAVTSRAEAQVLRLSCLFALLDCSATIRAPHLKAALAIWDYCLESARWIFGEALGDAVADELLALLRRSPRGLTRTEIRDATGRNRQAADIERGLAVLAEHGLARMIRERETEGARKPTERWFATGAEVPA